MKLTRALTKAVKETKYLSVDNHARYRLIMRLFYIHHTRINYWLNVNDVYDEVKEHIAGYSIDECKLDLENLVEWGNLINDHDTERIFTIQDFKNKKFRYQMTEYSVEIERLTVMLENMNVEGASLDIGLIGSIRNQVEQLRAMTDAENKDIYSWWRGLNESFKRLNREYQDYMKCFSFLKNEDNTTARRFISQKDDIIKYLRSFVKGIQKDGSAVAQELEECESIKDTVMERIIDYEYSVPRLSGTITREDISEDVYSKYRNLYCWFAGGENSEMERIMNITNSVIRSLTGYAAILAENINSMASRRDDYRLFAKMFMDCDSCEEAHRLSALLFGFADTCHIATDMERKTESISSGVYEEEPTELVIKPRVTTYRQRQQQSAIRDKSEEKKRMSQEHIRLADERRKSIEALIRDNKIIMGTLPVIDAGTRAVLLNWISRAASRNNRYKTEYGSEFKLIYPDGDKKIVLNCTDGSLVMPAFVLDFGEA